MAKLFLDTNVFIDLLESRSNINIDDFENDTIYVSALSMHIFCYLYKIKIPSKKMEKMLDYFNIVNFDGLVVSNSFVGPTDDFEDNVQLHSAAQADCDLFLTRDKKLLKLGFFGKVRLSLVSSKTNPNSSRMFGYEKT